MTGLAGMIAQNVAEILTMSNGARNCVVFPRASPPPVAIGSVDEPDQPPVCGGTGDVRGPTTRAARSVSQGAAQRRCDGRPFAPVRPRLEPPRRSVSRSSVSRRRVFRLARHRRYDLDVLRWFNLPRRQGLRCGTSSKARVWWNTVTRTSSTPSSECHYDSYMELTIMCALPLFWRRMISGTAIPSSCSSLAHGFVRALACTEGHSYLYRGSAQSSPGKRA